ncbi:Chloramphenicol 3-O phosphotransferase [Devosia sp. LC5]|uniref:chloramphenicol phosphotransferase CPT family protein n=1 Tax=Devosia sp. LC5 TaxID=1502724 RepID=UPI0004E34C5D|nr:AAA family ATPase [Devosia sp. LC5]KFC62884.1 Chloramphenicol 3-O phosphotransferase [Devosia sp. LC5]
MVEPGKIIFVHGASSSGKSTIARGIQAQIGLPFWHISIDHLRDAGVLPMARFKSREFDWKAARVPFFDGFHRSLAAYAAAGNNLVLEHILDTPGWLDDLVALFAPFDVFFVGVHCPLPLLIEREKARGDRPLGSAERDFHTIHQCMEYDFEVQTDSDAPGNVERVIAAWETRAGESFFVRRVKV